MDRAAGAPRTQDGRAASPSGGQQPDTPPGARPAPRAGVRGETRDPQRPSPGPRAHPASRDRLSRRCRNVHGLLWMGGAAPGLEGPQPGAWEASAAQCGSLLFAVFISLTTIKRLDFTQLTGQSPYVDTPSPFEESTARLPHPHRPRASCPHHLHPGSLVPSLPDSWVPDPHPRPAPRAPLRLPGRGQPGTRGATDKCPVLGGQHRRL